MLQRNAIQRTGPPSCNVTGPGRSATSFDITQPGTIADMDTADVIPITDFRRDTARIIAAHVVSETPVFITQGGYVSAVVLSPERYRDLIRQAGQFTETRGQTTTATAGIEQGQRPESWFGFVDAETADMLEGGGWELE